MRRLLAVSFVAVSVISCLRDPGFETVSGEASPLFGEWSSCKVDIEEFSGLCLNADGSGFFGVCDRGYLYSVGFDGTSSLLFDAHDSPDYDFEAVTVDPSTGNVYIGVERSQKILKLCAPYDAVRDEWTVDTGAGDPSGKGIEGLEWISDGVIMVGNQAGPALLLEYSLAGREVVSTCTVSGASYISDICYEDGNLWISDTKSGNVFLCSRDGTVRDRWSVGDVVTKPEGVCVDRRNGCIWFANDDSGDNLYRVSVRF